MTGKCCEELPETSPPSGNCRGVRFKTAFRRYPAPGNEGFKASPSPQSLIPNPRYSGNSRLDFDAPNS